MMYNSTRNTVNCVLPPAFFTTHIWPYSPGTDTMIVIKLITSEYVIFILFTMSRLIVAERVVIMVRYMPVPVATVALTSIASTKGMKTRPGPIPLNAAAKAPKKAAATSLIEVLNSKFTSPLTKL